MLASSCIDGTVKIGISAPKIPLIGQIIDETPTLYGKEGERAGRVGVCVNGTMGAVCNSNWDNKYASVVCTQLGYSPNGNYILHTTCS